MAMKNLSQLRTLVKEPQSLHRWQIDVPTWPVIGAPSNPDLLFFITTADLPTPTPEETIVELGGFPFQYNGKELRNGELSWVFYDNTDQEVTQYFAQDYPNARQNYASANDISLASATTADIICPVVNMNLLGPDGSTITKTYQLIDVLFHVTSYASGLGQQAEAQQLTLAVKYDAYVIK